MLLVIMLIGVEGIVIYENWLGVVELEYDVFVWVVVELYINELCWQQVSNWCLVFFSDYKMLVINGNIVLFV